MYRTTALFVLVCLLGVSTAADEKPVALPPAADVEKATKLIRELFKDDFAKTQTKARHALAEKLFKQAEETDDDPAARYALYREAAEAAATVGDVDLALASLDAIRARFTGVKAEQTEPVLKTLTTKAPPGDALTLANYLLKAVDEAVTADELDVAERWVKMAETAANRSKNVRTAGLASTRSKEVDAFKKEADLVRTALKELEQNPNDATSAVIAGRYYCFQKGEWEKGLPLLAGGNDAKLKDVAQKEVAGPKEPAELLAVADGWYDAGKAATATHQKRSMLARSYAFYTKAAPDLTGLTRTRVDKRLEELEKLVEARGQHDELWTAVRAAVRNKNVEELSPLGGIFDGKDYRENAPSGGVLIGFNYGLRKINNHDVIGYLQPIYLTPTGEKVGAAYGKAPAKPLVVKAKPGYAVGGLKISGGGHLESYSVTFMRIQGKGLNSADKYESPSMGRDRQFGGRAIGDDRPIVGIFGKRLNNDDDICTIGLIVAGPKPPRKD